MKKTLPKSRHRATLTVLLSLALVIATAAEPVLAQLWVRNTTQEPKTQAVTEVPGDQTISLTELLGKLKETHHVFFLYDQEKLQGKQVKLDHSQLKSVEKTLRRVLPPLKLHYKKLNDKNYLIMSADQSEEKSGSSGLPKAFESRTETAGLALPVSQDPSWLAMAVERRITGLVTSTEESRGVPGVSVRVKNSTLGTVTNETGNFSLNVPDATTTLVFSSVGYLTQEASIAGVSTLNVSLAVDQKNLDEVVVVGYGTQRKRDLTGAVASVKGDDLKNLPVNDLTTALQGRVPGAFISQTSGAPGAGSQIVIRGPVSINGGEPLYVVDGIPFTGTGYSFNIQDIESVEVLKDAAAAAIYGAKAAGGVILITTKKGKSGQLRVSFNANYGVRNVLNLPQTLRRDDYIKAREAYGFDVVDLYGPRSGWSSLPDTDWLGEVFRQGKEQNYTVALSGGGEKSRFYASANYNQIDGTRIGNWLNRYTFRINSEHQISKKLKFSEVLYAKYGREDPFTTTNQGDLSFRNTPLMKVYDPTNPTGGWGKSPRGFQGGHDVYSSIGNYQRNESYETNLALTLDYEVVKNLNLRATLGTSLAGNTGYNRNFRADIGSAITNDEFSKNIGKSQAFIATYTATYERTFGQHRLKGLAGYEARRSDGAGINFYNRDPLVAYPYSANLVKNVNTAQVGYGEQDYVDRILSQFGRVEYAFADKYLLTVNIRRDGWGEKFGPNRRFGVFPGVSVGWKLSDEAFMKTLPFVSFLKLRASYGLLGNRPNQNFAFATNYAVGYGADFGAGRQSSVTLASKVPNPDIQWEEVATTNVGLDGSVLNNRLNFNLDVYSRQTRKMLYDVGLAPSAGLGGSVPANIGQMSNKGVELYLEWREKRGDFSYSVGINGAHNINKLISLNPELGRQTLTDGYIGQNAYPQGRSVSRSEPGLPLGQFYGYQVEGIYQANTSGGEKRPKVGDYTPRAGDLIYVDQNNDGIINNDDRTYIGNPWPKLTYGLNLSLGYRGFDVRAFFNGVAGNQLYNVFGSFEHTLYSDYTTTAKIFETSGFGGNGVTDKPRVGKIDDLDQNGNWADISSFHVQNGSYLRLRNLQVGYTLPAVLTNKLRMGSLRVFAMGDNLLTFTKYKGINPEIGGGLRDLGIDNADYRYPISRLLSLGINADF
ncbi:MAG: TonB-dependent receptor [Cytophagaceae bacterium]|nr:TonB-dependent receptor [Cytophagaceae bacterium]